MNVGDDSALMGLIIDSPADGTPQLQINVFDCCQAAPINVCTVIYPSTNSQQLSEALEVMDRTYYRFSQLKCCVWVVGLFEDCFGKCRYLNSCEMTACGFLDLLLRYLSLSYQLKNEWSSKWKGDLVRFSNSSNILKAAVFHSIQATGYKRLQTNGTV